MLALYIGPVYSVDAAFIADVRLHDSHPNLCNAVPVASRSLRNTDHGTLNHFLVRTSYVFLAEHWQRVRRAHYCGMASSWQQVHAWVYPDPTNSSRYRVWPYSGRSDRRWYTIAKQSFHLVPDDVQSLQPLSSLPT